jgi:tellurite resistance protein TerC
MPQHLWFWIGFNIFIVAMLLLDLKVFHKDVREVRMKEAIGWSIFWFGLAMAFAAGVFFKFGSQKGLEFLTGYLIEESLSVDNLFVFLLVFRYFAVRPELQHKVLFWGILGALVLRLVFILAGVALLDRFHWLIYIFGAILIVSGARLWVEKDKQIHPENNPVIKLFRRFVPVLSRYKGEQFFVRRRGRLWATPLLLVLVFVETTDLLFAIDSIPAVLAISTDSFIVYTSNAFAVLGLRALYFALSGIMHTFHHLHYGLSATLIFVGGKMVAADLMHIPTWMSLAVVAVVLGISIWASIRWPARTGALPAPTDPA